MTSATTVASLGLGGSRCGAPKSRRTMDRACGSPCSCAMRQACFSLEVLHTHSCTSLSSAASRARLGATRGLQGGPGDGGLLDIPAGGAHSHRQPQEWSKQTQPSGAELPCRALQV